MTKNASGKTPSQSHIASKNPTIPKDKERNKPLILIVNHDQVDGRQPADGERLGSICVES